jgi:hypothetical protein
MANEKRIEMKLCLTCYLELSESHEIHPAPEKPVKGLGKREKCARCGDMRFCSRYELGGAKHAE